ncbi:hypothetical protein [Roseibium sp. MMSF_3544]|uniref:hypothetical protein n=1 Tax=Roseibium sp. MMSF_3544 TaxID=3046723 RepID=UPI00273F6777|nr:hypothetical protein [Roseibium sp. MMSF_3544]
MNFDLWQFLVIVAEFPPYSWRRLRPCRSIFLKVVLLTEVVVLMSAPLFSDLQKGETTAGGAAHLAVQSSEFNARSNLDLATPNPDADDSYFVTFFLDERAGEFVESIKNLDGVLSVYVKPEMGLP